MKVENPGMISFEISENLIKVGSSVSLRDYFAAAALQGLVPKWDSFGDTMYPEVAEYAYGLADALLAARGGE